MRRLTPAAGLILALATAPAAATDQIAGHAWLDQTTDILTEGIYWNDQMGDGKDRWRSGGLTQAWVFPENIWHSGEWVPGRVSLIEVGVRALVITPDNTANPAPGDRPFAQYLAGSVGWRGIAAPERLGDMTTLSIEDRVLIEIGWVGAPLPLFELQDMIHGVTGTGVAASRSDAIEGQVLANLDARRTWRLQHRIGERDIQAAPFAHVSAGMREVSLRIGADIFTGTDLGGRSWGSDLSTGAVMPGGSMPTEGFGWAAWVGGDVGHVAHDAFLDGGFPQDAPSVDRTRVSARLRTGLLVQHGKIGAAVSLNWLGREFENQPEGQLIGAVSLKYRF